MKNSDKAFVQAYNGQAAVDASGAQIIVDCALSNQSADAPHLPSMVEQVMAVTGSAPEEWSSNAGYCSADNAAVLEQAGIVAFVPPGCQAHAARSAPPDVAAVLAAGGTSSAGGTGGCATRRQCPGHDGSYTGNPGRPRRLGNAQADRRAGPRADQRLPGLAALPAARPA
jgi:hypothetical protein